MFDAVDRSKGNSLPGSARNPAPADGWLDG
jgi:hypothetical protein